MRFYFRSSLRITNSSTAHAQTSSIPTPPSLSPPSRPPLLTPFPVLPTPHLNPPFGLSPPRASFFAHTILPFDTAPSTSPPSFIGRAPREPFARVTTSVDFFRRFVHHREHHQCVFGSTCTRREGGSVLCFGCLEGGRGGARCFGFFVPLVFWLSVFRMQYSFSPSLSCISLSPPTTFYVAPPPSLNP